MLAARPPLLGDHAAAAEALHVDAGDHQVARLRPRGQDRANERVKQGPVNDTLTLYSFSYGG